MRFLPGCGRGDNASGRWTSIDDYAPFVTPFCGACARARAATLVYFRFARHAPLVPDDAGRRDAPACRPSGFETFIDRDPPRHRAGRARRVLRLRLPLDLADDWYSDRCWATSSCSPARTSTTCEIAGLLRAAARADTRPRRRRHSPRRRRSCSTSTGTRAALYVHPAQGAAALLAHDVHAARLGGRTVPAGHRERDDRRDPHLAPRWAGWTRPRLRLGVWNRTFLQARGEPGSHASRRRGRQAEARDACPSCCGW